MTREMGIDRLRLSLCLLALLARSQTCFPARQETSTLPGMLPASRGSDLTLLMAACAPPALAAAKTLVAGQSSNRGAQGENTSCHHEQTDSCLFCLLCSPAWLISCSARQGILRTPTGVLEDEILRTG